MHLLHNAKDADWGIPKIIHLLDETKLQGEHVDTSITPLLVEMSERPFQDVEEED